MINSSYQPPAQILEKYAKILVHFALGNDEGIKKDEVVEILVPDVAKAIVSHLQREVMLAGGHPLVRLVPTGINKDFYELASEKQLTFFPKEYLKAKAKLIDHSIGIIADPYPEELTEISPEKIVKSRDAKKLYRDWLIEKETAGDFTWTLALWGTKAKAKIVGLSLEEYWQQIIQACFLDQDDPIQKWREVKKIQTQIKKKLNQMEIEWLEVKGPKVDLKVKLGANRIWKGGADRNIPSFELFTSPDWREVEGWIEFNQPVYRYGNIIDGVRLELQNGLVVKASAKKGQKMLEEMLKSKNANKLGEFSLTDNRLSNITHFMAETLYDENIGGKEGNMHVAIGMAYRDCFRGDSSKVSKEEWAAMGYNDSPEHTDIVSTDPRKVTAVLTNGSKQVIYHNGRFTLY